MTDDDIDWKKLAAQFETFMSAFRGIQKALALASTNAQLAKEPSPLPPWPLPPWPPPWRHGLPLLPIRVTMALENAGIHTLEALVRQSREDLLRTRNLGPKSVEVIEATLAELGMTLAPDRDILTDLRTGRR